MRWSDEDKEQVFYAIEDIISSCGSAEAVIDHLDEILLGFLEMEVERRSILNEYLWDIIYTVSLLKKGFSKFGKIISYERSNETETV